MRHIVVLVGLIVVIGNSAIAQERVHVTNEVVLSTFETEFTPPPGWVIYGRQYKPVSDIITIKVDPRKNVEASVSFNAHKDISSQPSSIDPSNGKAFDPGYSNYHGNMNDFRLSGAYKLRGGLFASAAFMAVGIDESFVWYFTDPSGITAVPTSISRSYKAMEYGGGIERYIKGVGTLNASYHWMPKIYRSDNFDGNAPIDNDASGHDLKVAGTIEVYKHLALQLSFRQRSLTTPNGNKTFGIIPEPVPETATIRQFGVGITAHF